MVSIYLASTPLHILNSLAIAGKTEGEHHLILIDQPDVEKNIYFELLSSWKFSPFSSTQIFQGRIKSAKAKLEQRKVLFQSLRLLVEQWKPDWILTGNDRRIEFQFMMHACQDLGLQSQGAYMDEGTFTYVGRQASSGLGDKIIDNIIKKISYGLWWSNPPTIGGSHWVKRIFAAYPNLVVNRLKSKDVIDLKPFHRDNPSVDSFSEHFLGHFSFDHTSLANVALLITTPHESLIQKIPGYRDQLLDCIQQANKQGQSVAVKYHPRNTDPDILGLKRTSGVSLIPSAIPFELICPLMKDITLVGDLSSTLINASWLTPEVKVLALKVDSGNLKFDQLFNQLDIPVIEPVKLGDALAQLASES